VDLSGAEITLQHWSACAGHLVANHHSSTLHFKWQRGGVALIGTISPEYGSSFFRPAKDGVTSPLLIKRHNFAAPSMYCLGGIHEIWRKMAT
jgi:hypothetical protein